jgi:hypothetical protein
VNNWPLFTKLLTSCSYPQCIIDSSIAPTWLFKSILKIKFQKKISRKNKNLTFIWLHLCCIYIVSLGFTFSLGVLTIKWMRIKVSVDCLTATVKGDSLIRTLSSCHVRSSAHSVSSLISNIYGAVKVAAFSIDLTSWLNSPATFFQFDDVIF